MTSVDYAMVPPEQGENDKKEVFHFDVSFQVVQKGKTKVILNNVSDIVQSGQTLAIMGPSGKFNRFAIEY